MPPPPNTPGPFAIGVGSSAWIEKQRRALPAELALLAGESPTATPWLSRSAGPRDLTRLAEAPIRYVGFLATGDAALPGPEPTARLLRAAADVGTEWLAFLPAPQAAPSTGSRFDGPVRSFVCSPSLYRVVLPRLRPAQDLVYLFASTALQPNRPSAVLPPWQADDTPSPIPSVAAVAEPVTWLIPHRGDAAHLHACLRQVERDAAERDSIWVCLDEAPAAAHEDLLQHHPTVHFWRLSPEGMGPYVARHILGQAAPTRLLLFQDSDDAPVVGRRNALVGELLRSDADMIGSHELRIDERHGEVLAIRFPSDANAALRVAVEHPLFHPTSLVRVEALRRAGGFSTVRRFGADLQFLLRAHFTMRLRNCDEFLYLRRKRHGSLTTSPGIGLGEEQRQRQALRWKDDFVRVRDGEIPLAGSSLTVEPHPDLDRARLTYLNPGRPPISLGPTA